MAKVRLAKWEQETICNFNAEEKTANVYTADPVMVRKLEALCDRCPEYKRVRADENGREYEFPKRLIRFRAPKQMTEEQRQAAGERLRQMRKGEA